MADNISQRISDSRHERKGCRRNFRIMASSACPLPTIKDSLTYRDNKQNILNLLLAIGKRQRRITLFQCVQRVAFLPDPHARRIIQPLAHSIITILGLHCSRRSNFKETTTMANTSGWSWCFIIPCCRRLPRLVGVVDILDIRPLEMI